MNYQFFNNQITTDNHRNKLIFMEGKIFKLIPYDPNNPMENPNDENFQ